MSHRPSVVILTNVLAPYRVEFYRRLCADSEWDVCVLFGGDQRLSAKWRLTDDAGICGEELPRYFLGGTAWNPTLMARLRALAPAVIVCGGISLQALTALRYAGTRDVPLFIWWGGTALSEGDVTCLKRLWRRFVFGRATGFFAYSSLAADYLRSQIGSAIPIRVLGNNTLDATAWHDRVERVRPASPPARPIILCVGQLIPRKGYDIALEVVAQVARELPVELVLVGSGEEEAKLRAQARELGVADNVRFAGNVAHEETLALYAQATVFFHPARSDQWPQVVNEALAAGLPVLLSDTAGIPADFVRDGHNGFVRRADDVAGWVTCLQQLFCQPERYRAMGANAVAMARAQDVNYAVAEFRRGVAEVCAL